MTAARTAAWRIIAGGALVAFSVGTYLGHQAWADEPQHPIVWFERAHTPEHDGVSEQLSKETP